MNQEMVRQFFSQKTDEGKKPVRPWVILLILGSILFLVLGGVGEEKKPKVEKIANTAQELNVDAYIEGMEQRLKKTIETISGVGEVSVFLHLEDSGEQILATNKIRKSEEEIQGEDEANSVEEESEIVRWDQDGTDAPYRVKQRFPVPSGILVVAEGAEKEKVKQEIYEAVRAIFGLPAHRIKITN